MALSLLSTTEKEFAGQWGAIEREIARAAQLEEQARIDAMRDVFADLPDPKVYARYLPLHLVEALLSAHKHRTYGWMVAAQHAPELRSLGLVGFGRGKEGQGITAFGWAVRTALKAEDA